MNDLLFLYCFVIVMYLLGLIFIAIGFVTGNSTVFCCGDLIFLPIAFLSYEAYRKEYHKHVNEHNGFSK
jgi:hypothetical protein